MKKLLVTGSSGLIGSEVVASFCQRGWRVHGVDAHLRAAFLGAEADTRWNQQRLVNAYQRFTHHELDIRDRAAVLKLTAEIRPDAIVHAAVQPSPERAAALPFDDFDTNAGGTLNLLEAARRACPEAPFVFMSTKNVYGDRPNGIAIEEHAMRFDYADPAFANGIPETLSIDQSLHSPFGASKAAADLMVQEYGRSFGMPTCALRAGCVSGPHHSAVELDGLLAHLVQCNLEGRACTIYGHRGKQVRDHIHALDVARFVAAFVEQPRAGEVYNIGGGRNNACSMLQAIRLVERATGRPMHHVYVDAPRPGDHVCWYSDLTKIRAHYPDWDVTVPLPQLVQEIVDAGIVRKETALAS
jgi:CDP-paratose 2-epimerase